MAPNIQARRSIAQFGMLKHLKKIVLYQTNIIETREFTENGLHFFFFASATKAS